MFSKYGKNFFQGLLIGTMACLIYWYWQKSTQAEDGALDLLDRLKRAQDQLQRTIDGLETAVAPSPTNDSEDLTEIKGIGPKFAERLNRSGIHSKAQVGQLSTAQLAEILNIQPGRAERIQSEL